MAASGSDARLIDIGGGRRMYMDCRGVGGPTVILEAGYRSRADVWTDDLIHPEAPRTMVLPGIAAFTRVCAYDRPGTASVLDDILHPSRSDPTTMPRTAKDVVADLHALLHAAGVPGPYILVGHSFGGMFVRLYAATYPDDVIGLVLVDALSEQVQTLMTPAEWAAYRTYINERPPELATYRDLETMDIDASFAQMRGVAPPLRTLPLTVLSHGHPFNLPSDLPSVLTSDVLERAWQGAQSALAALMPGARHEIAATSGHYIQLEQPELVIEAVREIVEAVRRSPPGFIRPLLTIG
jgi:pimeloyl-ACP methyl ester carboxylesterase